MTDIEQKALALVNAFRAERGWTTHTNFSRYDETMAEAICRAIEQHEAFRQEVSDAVGLSIKRCGHDGLRAGHINEYLGRFIIAKPDPLVEVIAECDDGTWETKAEYADKFRAALEARGLEIREKGQ
jgi:hypothetical protein